MNESAKDLIILEDRPLTDREREFVRWCIEHGSPGSETYIPHLDRVRVISSCGCGCPSIDFSYDGVPPDYTSGLEVISDHIWGIGGIDLCGVFVFARNKKLAGFEVWSVDGQITPTELPCVEVLRSYSESTPRLIK